MRKFLLWAAAVTFSFAAFLASCATQPQGRTRAPAAQTQNDGSANHNADHVGSRGGDASLYAGGSLSR
jgi:hypothetical protein